MAVIDDYKRGTAHFSLVVIPEHIEYVIHGQVCVFLVSVTDKDFGNNTFIQSNGGTIMAYSSSNLIPEDTLEKAVEILKIIGHHDRLQIVKILLSGECQAGQLVNTLGALQSQTSQQLGKLKMHGVLKSRRDGNKTYYSLANDSIKRIVEAIAGEC